MFRLENYVCLHVTDEKDVYNISIGQRINYNYYNSIGYFCWIL